MIGVGQAGPLGNLAAGDEGGQQGSGGVPRDEGHHAGWTDLDLRRLDPNSERPYWIALSLVPGIGPASFGRLLHRFGSARAAWDAGTAVLDGLTRLPGDASDRLRRLHRAGHRRVARAVESRVRLLGGSVLIALDDAYPPALRAADPRPAVLYHAGDLSAFEMPAVAVVGTRRASAYGRSCAVQVADELSRSGVVVVSGLALGIDGEAHRAALDAGGRSVAVLPSPLDRIYPPRHRELAARLVATGGGLLTELAPGQSPGRPDFARRNRIIAGLARATVVIEAPDRSGALLTASAALAMGREVYAVPGQIDDAGSRGSNRLIADHVASLVTSPAALITNIGLIRVQQRGADITGLSDAEALVLARLLRRPASVDELLPPTRLSTGSLAGALTMLEARGLVASYGGATFHPTLVARRLARAG